MPYFNTATGEATATLAVTGALTAGTLNGVGLLTGTADPSAGAGVAATRPALYVRTGTDQLWLKTGAGDTNWTQIS